MTFAFHYDKITVTKILFFFKFCSDITAKVLYYQVLFVDITKLSPDIIAPCGISGPFPSPFKPELKSVQ